MVTKRTIGLYFVAGLVLVAAAASGHADELSNYTNVLVFPGDTVDQTEPSIAISPLNTARLLVGANARRRTGSRTFLSTEGLYYSTEAGSAWAGDNTLDVHLPGETGSDPSVAFDASGNAYFAYMRNNGQVLDVAKSFTAGETWVQSATPVSDANSPDKEHFLFDRSRNRLYVSWTEATGSNVKFKRSVDGGQTFNPDPPLSLGTGSGVNLAMGPEANLYAVWGGPSLRFNKSTDGGVSFAGEQTITNISSAYDLANPGWSATKSTSQNGITDVKANSFPAMAVDTASGSAYPGRIYVVWADKRNGDPDVFLIKSSSQGAPGSWSQTPIRVNQDQPIGNGKDQWLPWVSVDPYGGVNIVFYDCRNGAGLPTRVYMARSVDGGQSFTETQVSDREFNLVSLCDYDEIPGSACRFTHYMGDYIGITSSAEFIFPCWMEPRTLSTYEGRYIYNLVVARVPRIPGNSPGQIDTSTVWDGTVYVTGDVVINPGAIVTVRPGTRIVVKENRDDHNYGVDPARAEIIVEGILKIDSTGDPPVFKSDSSHAGTWYGVRTVTGLAGKIESGGGFYVQDAYKGITIASGTLASTLKGVRVENASLAGIWLSSSDVSLSHDTIVGVTPGYGIYLDQVDPHVDSCFVDGCETGIFAFQSSGTLRGNRIDGPGMYGIYVSSGGSYNDTLRVVRDSVTGYYTGAHLFAGYKGHCRIDSCSLIVNYTPGAQSSYGVYASQDAWVKVRRTKIVDFGAAGLFSFKSKANLGKTKFNNNPPIDDPGNNAIYSAGNAGPCEEVCPWPFNVVHIGNTTTDTLRAENNWWNADPPLSGFYPLVDRTPWLSSNPLPKLSPSLSEERVEATRAFEMAQNYPNPFNPSTRIGFELASTQSVQVRVFNILGQMVKVLVDQELPAGRHDVSWDGTDYRGSPLASGIYLCRLVAGGTAESKKMVLLR